MKTKRFFIQNILLILIVVLTLGLICIPSARAQYNWWPLPPYNTLWPLWSPELSPVSPITGQPTPIVDGLYPDTVLPVQPGLTWDPDYNYPWLLYNTPLGMVYYDPLYGIDLWPPSYLQNIFGNPLPITITLIDLTAKATSTAWLSLNVPIANNAYYANYARFAPLITPAAIVGLPPILP
ncbi:MAG: hypothetical protein ACMUIP_01905 [bacterium]